MLFPSHGGSSDGIDLDLTQPGPSTYQYPKVHGAPIAADELVMAAEPDEEDHDTLADDSEEPLFVNAKQYHRILKRRIARQRLEELNRLSRSRKVLFHPPTAGSSSRMRAEGMIHANLASTAVFTRISTSTRMFPT